jgi:hypothetical protein
MMLLSSQQGRTILVIQIQKEEVPGKKGNRQWKNRIIKSCKHKTDNRKCCSIGKKHRYLCVFCCTVIVHVDTILHAIEVAQLEL